MTTQELQSVRKFLLKLVNNDRYHLAEVDLKDFCDTERIPYSQEDSQKKKQIELLYVARRLENLFNDLERKHQVVVLSRSLERPLWIGQIVGNPDEIREKLRAYYCVKTSSVLQLISQHNYNLYKKNSLYLVK